MSVYHWSPCDRRREIQANGLQPYSQTVFHSGHGGAPYLCFAHSPSAAWFLSIGAIEASEMEEWDLWQVRLPDGADVRPLPYFAGRNTPEIRTYSTIPPDHLWLVATREAERFDDAITYEPDGDNR